MMILTHCPQCSAELSVAAIDDLGRCRNCQQDLRPSEVQPLLLDRLHERGEHIHRLELTIADNAVQHSKLKKVLYDIIEMAQGHIDAGPHGDRELTRATLLLKAARELISTNTL